MKGVNTMNAIRVTIPEGTKPTAEQLAEVRAAVRRPIVYDKDCPKQTTEQLKRFRRVNPRGASASVKQNAVEGAAL